METLDILRQTWYILIGFLFLGYSLLDGFDLGVGILFPLLAKKEEEKKAMFSAIGPFWDGNEVWLLTGGGALFDAFPNAYATVFSGFYLALMVVLFSLIFRAVSLEFRAHDLKRKRFWESTFMIGSILPALFFGVALGNVLLGVPLDHQMEFTGSFFTLLRPFPLVMGLLGFSAILLQGSTFAALKVSGELQYRSRKFAQTLIGIKGTLLIIALAATLFYIPDAAGKPLAWIFTFLIFVSLLMLRSSVRKSKDLKAFSLSSLSFLGLWGIAGSIHFPNLVKAAPDTNLSITIYNASSSALTLRVMLIIAVIGMPLVIGYTIYLYKVFRGKVTPLDYL